MANIGAGASPRSGGRSPRFSMSSFESSFSRPAAFRSLLRIAAATKPITCKMLIAPETTG
jgi:hypothetical protein